MRSKTIVILSTLLLCLISGKTSFSQKSSPCLAVVTEIRGEALIKRTLESNTEKVRWGNQLFKGDVISTSKNAEVKLLFSNNTLLSLGPNSSMNISGSESAETESIGKVKTISSATLFNLPSLTSKKEPQKDEGALADLRSLGANQKIEPGFPLNTIIQSSRPSFTWIAGGEYLSYSVKLYNKGGLVWTRRVSGKILNYPEDEKELIPGEEYFWIVEGENLIESEKSASHKFSILQTDKKNAIKESEEAIRTSFIDNTESSSYHSVLGAFYVNQGLLQDAIHEFDLIAQMNPAAPLPHEILGSLYNDVNEKDKAIAELQKALSLSKVIDK